VNAKQFIEQVEECRVEQWAHSDLWAESERALEAIADHLKVCPDCRGAFDAMGYEAGTLVELEAELGTIRAQDFTCGGGSL